MELPRDPSHGGELLVEYRRNLSKIGGDLRPIVCDVLSQDDIQQCVDEISQFDQADPSRPFLGLVNNAGFCMISPMELTSREDIMVSSPTPSEQHRIAPTDVSQRMLDLDLLAYISTTRAFLPLLKRHSGGRVINIGSYGGYTPVPGWVTYNAVKAAIDNMTRAWNFETIRAYGIKMTVVRPGWVATAGIGPKIVSAMERFDDEEVDLKAGRAASGFDSLGNVLRVEEGMDGSIMRKYTTMMEKWKTLVRTNTALGTPPEHVAKTVMDALVRALLFFPSPFASIVSPANSYNKQTDAWLQPVYTVAWDALLAQMVRDFIPEPLYEWWVVKSLT